jgi:hypothetical protein
MTINQSTNDNPHYVTPVEAKEKICPLKPNQMSIWCEGPKCMAWRWKLKKEAVETKDAFYFKDVYSPTHGYCGMVRS